jgi:hypothetical protein
MKNRKKTNRTKEFKEKISKTKTTRRNQNGKVLEQGIACPSITTAALTGHNRSHHAMRARHILICTWVAHSIFHHISAMSATLYVILEDTPRVAAGIPYSISIRLHYVLTEIEYRSLVSNLSCKCM